jgi:TPR repeat protein/serine/threonine protein kinase
LEERVKETGALSLPDVARLVDQTASALAAAHALGIVHRDIKPDNLFLEAGRPSLYVKVLDFGIAKDTAPKGKGRSLTAAGMMVGSPFFMSPEQMESAKDVGPATDIFSLGAVTYYALTGKLPFDGDTPVELWNAKKTLDFLKASHCVTGCPKGLDAWFDRAFAPTPAARFASPQEMAIAFSESSGMASPLAAPRNIRTNTTPLADPEATKFPAYEEPLFPSPTRDSGTAPLDLDPGNALSRQSNVPRTIPPTEPPATQRQPGPPANALRAAGITAAQAPIIDPRISTPHPPVSSSASPSIARPPSRSSRTSSGLGKIVGIGFGALLVIGAAGVGVYFATREPPAVLPKCKETQPEKCLHVATELLDDDKEREAFRYLAVAALRDSRLHEAHAALEDLGKPEFESSEKRLLSDACDEGKALACYLHARMVDEAFDRHAISYLEERCDGKKDASACAELGAVHDTGRWGVKANPKEGVAYHRAACTQGNARGCVRLGRLIVDSLAGLKKNEKKGVGYFKTACKKKDLNGCMELGRAHARALGGLERDLDKAADFFDKACKGDVLEGCWELGIAFARARGSERDQKRAVALYERACEGGIMPACTEWGRMHEHGNGELDKDVDRALELYKKACEAKDPSGCVELGIAYEIAKGTIGKDETKAVALYQQACDADFLEGCRTLANAHSRGMGGLEKDLFRAFELNRRACDGGNLSACINVGFYHSRGIGGANKDDKRARELYEQACDGGELLACSNLGVMHAHGKAGFVKDKNKARELFEKACDDGFGDLAACANMGVMHANGSGGLKKDVGRAAKIYESACNKGGQMACVNLGGLYQRGVRPIKLDRARAVRLYERACNANYATGCSMLGVAYEQGHGVSRDEKKAVELYQRGCDSGNAVGCANLARMFERGRGGLTLSRDRARELYRKACAAGNEYSCKAVKRLGG